MSKKTSMAKLKEIHFLRQDVFKDISEITFNRKFFKFFSNYSLKKNDVIFEKNDPTDEILFIRNGEIQLSLKISLNEMKKMISKLILLTNNFPPLDCQKFDQIDQKELSIIRNFKLCIKGQNEILGLQEFLYEKNWEYQAKIISDIATLYKIDYEVNKRIIKKLRIILNENSSCLNTFTEITKHKSFIFTSRLIELYKSTLNLIQQKICCLIKSRVANSITQDCPQMKIIKRKNFRIKDTVKSSPYVNSLLNNSNLPIFYPTLNKFNSTDNKKIMPNPFRTSVTNTFKRSIESISIMDNLESNSSLIKNNNPSNMNKIAKSFKNKTDKNFFLTNSYNKKQDNLYSLKSLETKSIELNLSPQTTSILQLSPSKKIGHRFKIKRHLFFNESSNYKNFKQKIYNIFGGKKEENKIYSRNTHILFI